MSVGTSSSQQFTNLLNSPGYTANVVALFQREQGLGLAYPPMIHLGYPTLGRGWWSNKPGFTRLCRNLGIHVPLDEISPLAPFGSMYFARPEALRLLVEHDWTYEDFGGAEAYQDGGLAHILERMPSYAAGELGYHTRTIANAEYMAIELHRAGLQPRPDVGDDPRRDHGPDRPAAHARPHGARARSGTSRACTCADTARMTMTPSTTVVQSDADGAGRRSGVVGTRGPGAHGR